VNVTHTDMVHAFVTAWIGITLRCCITMPGTIDAGLNPDDKGYEGVNSR
jgi:hypothetical protein